MATASLSGYLTSDNAITFLLGPTKPKLRGLIYGVFFQRREQFGASLIETAYQRFLNPELFNELIQAPAVAESLRRTIREGLMQIAGRDWGLQGT